MSALSFIILTVSLLYIPTLCPAANLGTLARQPLKSCKSTSDCPEGEECINKAGLCTASDCDGVCTPRVICSCQEPCEDGQTCVETLEGPVFLSTCVPNAEVEALSAIAEPLDCAEEGASDGNANDDNADDDNANGESSEDPVCIAVDMLHEFEPHELLFEKHLVARVLCDSAGSCATRGHIVTYQGRGMMMGNYCMIVGCEERVMHVNSPRYRRGLKVGSRSSHMEFTAFAARYETSAEEAVLAAAVRLGL